MNAIQGFFAALLVIWAFLIVAPQENEIRARNMCAPFEVIVRVFGASTKAIDESTGESISKHTSTNVGSSCRSRIAPAILASVGRWQGDTSAGAAPAQGAPMPAGSAAASGAPGASAPAAPPKPARPIVPHGMSQPDAL